MQHVTRTVFCVGASSLVREVSAVAGPQFRVRWVADLAALRRAIGGSPIDDVAACVVGRGADGSVTLAFVRAMLPAARRVVVSPPCEPKVIDELIETGNATAVLCRPLHPATLDAALRPAMMPLRKSPAQRAAMAS
jgi:hypothetical protein